VRVSRLEAIPNQSPRYSPVGSKLSVAPNDCSHPTFRVPPAATWLLADPAEPAATATNAATATSAATETNL